MILSIILLSLCLASINVVAEEKLILCYYGTWATYRHGLGQFNVEHIDPHLCTHLIYTFVGINNQGTVISLDPWLDLPDNWGRDNFRKFNDLKKINPKLKTILAVGGWNEGSAKYSVMAADPAKRKNFVSSALNMVRTHGFDGFDVDWEYPNRRDTVHGKADIDNFTTVLKELKQAFEPYGLLVTAAVAAVGEMASQSYDIPAISKYLDIISIMAYDLYGAWDPVTGHNAGLHKGQGDEGKIPEALFTVDFALKYWLDQGCPPEKLVLGVPFYGRTFTLSNPSVNGVRAPASGAGIAGPHTATNGFIGYNEFCSRQKTESWNLRFDDLARVPFAVLDRNWVSYDDAASLVEKIDFGSTFGIAGFMIWSIETDDFHGLCHGETFPLLKAVNRAAGKPIAPVTTIAPKPPTSTTPTPTERPTTPTPTERPTTATPTERPTTPTPTERPTTPTPTERPTTPTPTERPTTATPPQQPTTTTTAAPTTPKDSPVCKENGFAPNPENCSSFYICVDIGTGEFQHNKFHCPNGLHWDQENHFCNYAQHVKCNI